jgi:hypothetical protein
MMSELIQRLNDKKLHAIAIKYLYADRYFLDFVSVNDVLEMVDALFREFEKTVIPTEIPKNPTKVELFEFWIKYRLKLHEFMERWRPR